MIRNTILKIAFSILTGLLSGATAMAQDDKLVYVLTRARVDVDESGCRSTNVSDPCNSIEVLFGKSFPAKEAAEKASNWLIIAVSVDGTKRNFTPREVNASAPEDKIVILKMAENLNSGGELDRTTNRIIIVYQQQNLPTVTLAAPPKRAAQRVFTAAKGEKDSDIYFSGLAVAQRNSGPLYSVTAKLGYLQSLQRAGAIGGRAKVVSEQGSDVDPDIITAAAAYQKIFVLGSPTGIILNSEFIALESNKKNTIRNLTTGLDATLVLPSLALSRSTLTYATMDFMAGFDAGHNYKHPQNVDGLGNFWRPKFGANAYLVVLKPRVFNRINVAANYLIRLPRSSEPFTKVVDGTKVTSLTRGPRHDLGIDLGLMFAPSYGLTIQYRYGSSPPAFNFVDNKVSVGFTLQLKQANK